MARNGNVYSFIIHNVLNFHWYSKIIKGRYSIIRIIYLVINILVLISMLVQMYSGIVMSQYILTSLNIPGHISTVRKLHILGAYWGIYTNRTTFRYTLEYPY